MTQAAKGAKQSVTIIGEHPHTTLVNAPYFQDAVRQALKTELQLDERTIDPWRIKGLYHP